MCKFYRTEFNKKYLYSMYTVLVNKNITEPYYIFLGKDFSYVKKLANEFMNKGYLPIVYLNDVLYNSNKPFYMRNELLNNIHKLHNSCIIKTVSYLENGIYKEFQSANNIFEYKIKRKEFIFAYKEDGTIKTNNEILYELENIPKYTTIEILTSKLLE